MIAWLTLQWRKFNSGFIWGWRTAWRTEFGRFYVFRDAPDYVVEDWANTDFIVGIPPDDSYNGVREIAYQARAERTLRITRPLKT